jgi:hypothetical protein
VLARPLTAGQIGAQEPGSGMLACASPDRSPLSLTIISAALMLAMRPFDLTVSHDDRLVPRCG